MKDHAAMNEERRRAIEHLLANEGVDRLVPKPADPPILRLTDQAEYTKARQVWDELGDLKAEPDYADLLGRPTWRERCMNALETLRAWPAPLRLTVAGAALAGVAALMVSVPRAPAERFTTQIAETRQLALQDGSTVALGPKSALEVAFSPSAREVNMPPGEAYFSVTPDPGRPFVITAGDTRITVVGTKFNVKYDSVGVRVSVVEGLVKVDPPRGALFAKPKQLAVPAGKEAVVARMAEAPVIASLGATPPDTWRTGQLDYNDVRLGEIVADLNRYLPQAVRIESDRLADARLTTSFRAEQATQFLESLPGVLPLNVQRREGGVVLTDRRAP